VEWNHIETEDRHLFSNAVRSRVYEPGETLFGQGEENRGVFCVRSGLAGLRRSDEHGNSAILRLARPGDLLGYPAFLGKKNHPNTAEVLTKSTICFIEASKLRWILARNPRLMESFVQRALTDLSRTEANCASLLTAGLRCRLFHLILIFYESHGAKLGEGNYAVDLPVQRKDLAALLGAKPESISRLISRLDEEGLVRFEGRRVAFSDLGSLTTAVASFN
jgi:CRP/FNR family transcriptional regulator